MTKSVKDPSTAKGAAKEVKGAPKDGSQDTAQNAGQERRGGPKKKGEDSIVKVKDAGVAGSTRLRVAAAGEGSMRQPSVLEAFGMAAVTLAPNTVGSPGVPTPVASVCDGKPSLLTADPAPGPTGSNPAAAFQGDSGHGSPSPQLIEDTRLDATIGSGPSGLRCLDLNIVGGPPPVTLSKEALVVLEAGEALTDLEAGEVLDSQTAVTSTMELKTPNGRKDKNGCTTLADLEISSDNTGLQPTHIHTQLQTLAQAHVRVGMMEIDGVALAVHQEI